MSTARTTPPAAGGGATPAGGVAAPCPGHACPAVEIEINNTPETTDDLVPLKCTHPAGRVNIKCRIRATGTPSAAAVIVLTNPDGRLRFPGPHDTTHTVTVPQNGHWVPFLISGEKGSDAIGDAVIEAHCHTARGELKGSKPATVFWFDQPQITLTAGGSYNVVGSLRFTATGGAGINHSAQARIRPAGVSCTAPQVTNLRVGIMQNTRHGVRNIQTWGNPVIAWAAGVASGTTVQMPQQILSTTTRPVDANDSEASVAPLYDQPGKTGTLSAASLQPPMGCGGGAAATSRDTPSTSVGGPLTLPAVTAAGVRVGTVTYTFINTTFTINFIAWVVIFDTSTKHFCALRQRGWALNANSSTPGTKATADAADADPTNPITRAPFSNAIVNNPRNTVSSQSAAKTTFTAP